MGHGIKYALDLANDRQSNGEVFWRLLKNDAFFSFWLRRKTQAYMAETPLDALIAEFKAEPPQQKKTTFTHL